MRLSVCVSNCAPSRLNVTNGKGRPSVIEFFHFLGFTVLMVAVICYGVGYDDGHKYGRRR